jgi:hypothetical protein
VQIVQNVQIVQSAQITAAQVGAAFFAQAGTAHEAYRTRACREISARFLLRLSDVWIVLR